MFVAVNRIDVPNSDEMTQMFKHLSPELKKIEGFLGFEIWKTEGKLKVISRLVYKSIIRTIY